MTASSKTGGQAAFYISPTGDFAAPVYCEVKIAKDVSSDSSTDKKEDTCRGNVNVKLKTYVAGKQDKSISLEVCHRTDDACWNMLCDAEATCSPIEVMKLDCPSTVSGAKGFRFMAGVFSFNCNQPLEDPQNDTFEFAPVDCGDGPLYERVSIP